MARYEFAILDNGREVDGVDGGAYPTEAEAMAAGLEALDDVCPAGSKHRSAYRVVTREADGEGFDYLVASSGWNLRAFPDLLEACRAAESAMALARVNGFNLHGFGDAHRALQAAIAKADPAPKPGVPVEAAQPAPVASAADGAPSAGNLVEPVHACPSCGERDADNLLWIDDVMVACQKCATHYEPACACRSCMSDDYARNPKGTALFALALWNEAMDRAVAVGNAGGDGPFWAGRLAALTSVLSHITGRNDRSGWYQIIHAMA